MIKSRLGEDGSLELLMHHQYEIPYTPWSQCSWRGIRRLRLEGGGWKLEAEGWRIEAGGWMLKVGG